MARSLPVFLAAGLRRPGVIGAVAPSSRGLAEVLATVVPRDGRPTVVELGPGTGAVSATIGRHLPPGGRHFAVEIDSALASHLERSQPGVVVLRGDAAGLDGLLTASGAPPADAVVCGLPWSLFAADRQRLVLAQVCRALVDDGRFSTFAYWHAAPLAGAKRFRILLDDYFDEVVRTRTVWRNLPPALVYVCRGPRRDATPS